MIRAVRFLLALYLAVILQTLLAPAIEIFGVRPDFPLLLVLLVALKEGPAGGALTGFLAGLFVDVNSAQTLGVTSLANSLVAFGVGSFADRLVRESLWTRVVVALVATVFRDQIVFVLAGAGDFGAGFRMFFRQAIPGGIYTAVFAPLVMSIGERVIRWRKEPSRAYR